MFFLALVALPLSLAASPGGSRWPAGVFAASLVLFLVVSARHRRRAAQPCPAMIWPARAYFALGVGVVLAHDRFGANELAGMLLLFAPLALALALGTPGDPDKRGGMPPPRRAWRFPAALLALLFVALIVSTWSRGGLVALLVAAGAVAWLLGRQWIFALGALAVAMALFGPSHRLLDFLIYDGKLRGVSIDMLLTGRPEIWRRSLHTLADFPVTGIGVGTYSDVVPILYSPPGAARLEDAHNLFLQTALDLGLAGLLAFATILWLAFRRLAAELRRTRPTGGPRRAWAVGLFASLAAFTVFNLVDSVSFGTVGGVAFWFLLGLVHALPPPPRGRRGRWRPRMLYRARRRLVLAAILTLLGLTSLRGSLEHNRVSLAAARALVSESAALPAAHAGLARSGERLCRASWLEGKVAAARGLDGERDAAWSELLACTDAFTRMMEEHVPSSEGLARRAVAARPDSAAARFWLARIRAGEGENAAAEDLYRRGLELDPRDARAWQQLGQLLLIHDPAGALEAFSESCFRGDPGAGNCTAAGRLAERLGDDEQALRHYRRSRLRKARERVKRLEENGRR